MTISPNKSTPVSTCHKKSVNGWLNLYKPVDMSSAKAVAIVKRVLGAKKVGHAGTLDPMAQGVLPLAIGEATKVVQYMVQSTKSYQFDITWGSSTDTLDADGVEIASSSARPSKESVEHALVSFIGEIDQIPPAYSAIKVDGKRAYALARQGHEVKLKSRSVHITLFELIQHSADISTFRVLCSKGTYVRSLAKDLADKLGCCAHVSTLIRTSVGEFSAEDTILLENLEKMVYEDPSIGFLQPIESVLDDIPVLEVGDKEKSRCVFGQLFFVAGHGFPKGQRVQLLKDNVFFALAEIVDDTTVKPVRLFMCNIDN